MFWHVGVCEASSGRSVYLPRTCDPSPGCLVLGAPQCEAEYTFLVPHELDKVHCCLAEYSEYPDKVPPHALAGPLPRPAPNS